MTGVEAALASGLLKVVGNKLGSLISSEFAAITGMKKDLSDLQDIHAEITSWLSAVRDRAIERDPSLRWVRKLRILANDIDDLLDEVWLEDEKHKIHNDHKKHAFADFCAKPKLLLFRRKVAHKIKAIKVTFDAIVKQRTNANTILHSFQVDNQPVQSRNDKATGEQSFMTNVQESKIPSRDHVKSEIISKLVDSNRDEDGYIVSIIGLGGSGKTTLAQHICHDDKIKGHFKDTIFWVHVSHEFCRDKLIGKLFEAITKKKSDLHPPQHMVDAISRKLSSKRFLLVLDDAWHEDRHDWENFMVLLNNNGASGSKILLTTRNQNVAKAVGCKYVFNLGFLTEDESWSFFLKSSGWVEEDFDSDDFIQVGKDIVKKSGGVPLAIKTIGSVLQENRIIDTWRAIKESNLWEEENIEDRVFASLKLSFIHLKDHLKQCFAFCSIFPKGYRINKDYLIEQWIAHGFIKCMKEERPEDIGSGYFNCLVKGGFLQGPPETEANEITVCWMHDLINDLAQYILQNEVVTSLPKNIAMDCACQCRYLSLTSLNEDVESGFEKVRALYVAEGNPSFPNLVKKSGHIHSVILDYKFDTQFPSFILKLQYLGYLEIHKASFTKFPEAISECWNLQSLHFIDCSGFVTLPKSIGKLRKLRTLEMKGIADLESLPQSIGEFNNLQTISLSMCWKFQALPRKSLCHMLRTLDLSSTNINMLPQWVTMTSTLECIDLHHCRELVELPKGIGNLKRLRVLNIEGCHNLRSLPSGVGQLTCLRKLGLFVVGCGGDDASISELENLDKLSGQLEITNLKYLKDPADAGKSYLKHMNNIRSLVLDCSLDETQELELLFAMEQDQGILSALEPPSQIKNITITGYRGHCLPWWMMKQNDSSYCEAIMLKQTEPCEFISLTELTLQNCPNLKQMHGLWVLPSLKSLFLYAMANLEEVWTVTSDFENSEEEILRGQCCFPALSYMDISGCPRLNVKPYFPPSLKKLELCNSNVKLLSPVSFSQMLPPGVNESSSYSIHSAVSHLKELELTYMMMGSSGWELLQHHTQLETFSISGCNEMTELPKSIRSLTNLRNLRIEGCSTLSAMPDWLGELCSLRSLYVGGTPMVQSLPQSTKHLRSLVTLQIGDWDNDLKQLPKVIQHLASLEFLNLMGFDALTELPKWIGQLFALRDLYIQSCPALECLPQSIRCLTALRSLRIYKCPGLGRRYKRGVGPDWHLVSHIPHVDICLGDLMRAAALSPSPSS